MRTQEPWFSSGFSINEHMIAEHPLFILGEHEREIGVWHSNSRHLLLQ